MIIATDIVAGDIFSIMGQLTGKTSNSFSILRISVTIKISFQKILIPILEIQDIYFQNNNLVF